MAFYFNQESLVLEKPFSKYLFMKNADLHSFLSTILGSSSCLTACRWIYVFYFEISLTLNNNLVTEAKFHNKQSQYCNFQPYQKGWLRKTWKQ